VELPFAFWLWTRWAWRACRRLWWLLAQFQFVVIVSTFAL
jgi:hypothetical protein